MYYCLIIMAKSKKIKGKDKIRIKSRSFGAKPVVWIVLGVLLVIVIYLLARKDGNEVAYASNEIGILADNCAEYARNTYRSGFCQYNLVNGDLVNCRDSRILEILVSKGVDTSISSLNCRSIDIYTFRKDACLGYPANTKIADTTCADYQ